jgi:acid stress chaperone HdeB
VRLLLRRNKPRYDTDRFEAMRVPMKKLTIAVVAAALMSASLPASAQKLDLSTVKCKEFLGSGAENIAFIMMWMQGYYSDQEASPIVDFDKMKEDIGKLSEYCKANGDNGLITAAEEVLQ